MMTEKPQDRRAKDAAAQHEAAQDGVALEPFFAAARLHSDHRLPDALQARLLHDAQAVTRHRGVTHLQPGRRLRPDPWSKRLAAAFGGMIGRALGAAPGAAVVAVAGLAGVWIGFAAPEPASEMAIHFWQGAGSVAGTGTDWADAARDLGDDEALVAFLDSF